MGTRLLTVGAEMVATTPLLGRHLAFAEQFFRRYRALGVSVSCNSAGVKEEDESSRNETRESAKLAGW